MAGQARRQTREEFLRGRIDPVNVLEDQDEWRCLARAEKDFTEHAEGPLLELGTEQAVEKFNRGGRAEEVGEQERPFLSLQAQELKLFANPAPDFLAGDPIGETEVASHQL